MLRFLRNHNIFNQQHADTPSSCNVRLDRQNVAVTLFPLVQKFGPLLHHRGPIFQIVGVVVGAATTAVQEVIAAKDFYSCDDVSLLPIGILRHRLKSWRLNQISSLSIETNYKNTWKTITRRGLRDMRGATPIPPGTFHLRVRGLLFWITEYLALRIILWGAMGRFAVSLSETLRKCSLMAGLALVTTVAIASGPGTPDTSFSSQI